ncbi:MAG: outer membrane beta-barrel protein [Syntrophaceae bacterium]|nr:outer membrane beta-barrel protein [Syntrophaceae bacterium]
MLKSAVRVAVAAAVLVMALPAGASADEFRVVPSLALKEEYNDNILFSTNNPLRSWITTVSPGLELVNRTEKVDLSLSGRVDIARYHNESDYNREDQYYRARLGYLFGPRTNIQAEGGWSRDYRPDRDVIATGIVLGNYRRDRATGGLSGNWAVTERLTAGASYFYENDNYDDPTISDLEGHNVSLGLYHALGLSTKGRFNVGYSGYRYTSSDVNGVWSTVGIEHRFQELWTVVADAGGRFTRSEYKVTELVFVPPIFLVPVTRDVTSEDWGGVGKLSVNYRGEKTTLSLSANHDLATASGREGPVQRTAFVADIRHRLTYEFSAALSTGYYINHASGGQFGAAPIDEETFRVSPSLRYAFTKDMFLELLYDYTATRYKNTDTDAERNLVFLRFYVQYPVFE